MMGLPIFRLSIHFVLLAGNVRFCRYAEPSEGLRKPIITALHFVFHN